MSNRFEKTEFDCPNCENGKLLKIVDADGQTVAKDKVCKFCGHEYKIERRYRMQEMEDMIAIDKSTGKEYRLVTYKVEEEQCRTYQG